MLLEWFTSRHFWWLQLIRLLVFIPVWVTGWLIKKRTAFAKRHIDILAAAATTPISWLGMCAGFFHTGYHSPFLIAFFMVLMSATGLAMLWPLWFSCVYFGVVDLAYFVPLMLGYRPTDWTLFGFSEIVIVLLAIVILSSQQKRLKTTRAIYDEKHASTWPNLGLPSHIGRYEVLTRLGIGGMAETFIAKAVGPGNFEQPVCIKNVLPGFQDDSRFQKLFMEEARITASLRHSNIVTVRDYGHDPHSETLFLALELVDGLDLRQLLRHQPYGTLPHGVITKIAVDIAQALVYAHNHEVPVKTDDGQRLRRGVIHRDISPSNILLSREGEVKLTDFGVAKELRTDESKLSTGFKGKLVYMSPEQLRGDRLDGRSDLFSLGITLYECLVGWRPFDADSDIDMVNAIITGTYRKLRPICPADTPTELMDAIESLLIPDISLRCESAQALLTSLERIPPTLSDRKILADLVVKAKDRMKSPKKTHPTAT